MPKIAAHLILTALEVCHTWKGGEGGGRGGKGREGGGGGKRGGKGREEKFRITHFRSLIFFAFVKVGGQRKLFGADQMKSSLSSLSSLSPSYPQVGKNIALCSSLVDPGIVHSINGYVWYNRN